MIRRVEYAPEAVGLLAEIFLFWGICWGLLPIYIAMLHHAPPLGLASTINCIMDRRGDLITVRLIVTGWIKYCVLGSDSWRK